MLSGLVRLVHPFPSALDTAVTFALALVAGATPGRAALLGVAMLTIQFSIGAFNDVLDAPADAVAGRSKPLVDGRIPARVAFGVAAVARTLGRARAIRLGALLSFVVGGIATTSAVVLAGSIPGTWLTCAGAATLAAGVGIGVLGQLQRAWEVQAIGLGILATGWVA